jgi:hypothetical protein
MSVVSSISCNLLNSSIIQGLGKGQIASFKDYDKRFREYSWGLLKVSGLKLIFLND